MQNYFRLAVAGLCLALASPAVNAGVCANDRDLDSCLSGSDPVASCQRALAKNKNDTSARLSLCEAYVGKDELEKARGVLQQGIDQCGRRRCADLKLAESNVRERLQNASRQVAQPMTTDSRDRAYCSGPIANTRSIAACKRLLEANTSDVAIAEVLADKLLKTRQPAQAASVLSDIANLTTAGRALLATARKEQALLVADKPVEVAPTPSPVPQVKEVVVRREPAKVAPPPVAKTEVVPEPQKMVVAQVKKERSEPKVTAKPAPVAEVARVETMVAPLPTPVQQEVEVPAPAADLYANAMDGLGRSH